MQLSEEDLSGGSPPARGERMVPPLAPPSSSAFSAPLPTPIDTDTTSLPHATIVNNKAQPLRSYMDALLENAEPQVSPPPSIISPPWETFDLLGLDLATKVPVAAVRELIFLGFDLLGDGPFVEACELEKLEILEGLEALADEVDLDEECGGEGSMLDIFKCTVGTEVVEAAEEQVGWEDEVVPIDAFTTVETKQFGRKLLFGRQYLSEVKACPARDGMDIAASVDHGHRTETKAEGAVVSPTPARIVLVLMEILSAGPLPGDKKLEIAMGVGLGRPLSPALVAGMTSMLSPLTESQGPGMMRLTRSSLMESPGFSVSLKLPPPPPTGIGTVS